LSTFYFQRPEDRRYAQGFEQCPIDIELTESCLIDNAEQALEVIEQFRSLGAQIHLDDFGTGYSSLSQLARFPIDTIKLDHILSRASTTVRFPNRWCWQLLPSPAR
jgi:EAL domain-containing protein (putative c-di-GMP-specific phosphodiesterase class I)